jgi:endonuclease/exonuclease/phosphatase (EEP) superfamily protein YafD
LLYDQKQAHFLFSFASRVKVSCYMNKVWSSVLLLMLSCTEVVLIPEPIPEPEPELPTIRIATFNVRRFFDPVCDSGDCGGGAFESLPSQGQFDSRANQLATAIADLDADVVLLQEVETEDCLDAIVERSGGTILAEIGEISTPGSLDVAVFSRVQMLGVHHHRPQLQLADGRFSIFSRELLEAHFVVGGVRVITFVVHFRSKVNDDPLRRLAEAEVAAQFASSRAVEFPDALIILGGDFNDVPNSPPLNAIDDAGLIRVAEELGAGAATFVFQGNPQAIDHLMLMPTLGGVYLSGTAEVISLGGYGGSDHAALLADFELRPTP